jgi:hypothetical protein
MSQHYPNFTSTTPRAGQPAPVQTKRVAFTATGNLQQIDLAWDAPFADANYTVVYSVEVTAGNTVFNTGVFTKTASGISVIGFQGNFNYGYAIHAVAFKD